ncbi:MAG: hypothetical protein SPLUMA2_SPLUMAMAG2_01781 [uncultured Sulfurimonas sp.]|nr:MAG: hypothetical protein SPLUMA2_SPLUMAMAG2_01781 [uncultured Sulfurimonas sp.]
MNNKVSIIIPTYNGEKYIKETIDSCVNQSHSNVEIVVIDDCSSDNTVSILKSYKDKICLYFNESNQGITKNVNKGVELCTGDYFILLGHDDVLLEKHIELMLSEFDEDIMSVYCNSVIIDANNNELSVLLNNDIQNKKIKNPLVHLAVNNFISSCGMIHKTEIFKKFGGWDEEYKNYGEWLFYIKMLRYGKIKYSLKTKSKYRRHDTNITNTFKDKNVKKYLNHYFKDCRVLAHNEGDFSLFELFLIKVRLLKLTIISIVKK